MKGKLVAVVMLAGLLLAFIRIDLNRSSNDDVLQGGRIIEKVHRERGYWHKCHASGSDPCATKTLEHRPEAWFVIIQEIGKNPRGQRTAQWPVTLGEYRQVRVGELWGADRTSHLLVTP